MDNTCPICLEYRELTALECEHYYCFDCLNYYINNKVNESEHEIPCPSRDCDEYISYRFIDNLLSDSIVKKLDRNIVKHTVHTSDNLKFCPKCDNVCEKDYDDTVECENCNYTFCYSCGYEKESDHVCSFELIEDIREALEFENDDTREIKLCPKCNVIIHKYHGCDSMKCPYCRFRFCWNCLKLDQDIKDMDLHRVECSSYDGFERDITPDPSDDD